MFTCKSETERMRIGPVILTVVPKLKNF